MKKILLSLFFISVSFFLKAQAPYTITANTSSCCGGDDNGMGSSFLTSTTGKLDSIDVYIRTGSKSTGTLFVYEGNTTNPAAQIYTQTLTRIPTGILNALYRVRLTTPVTLGTLSTYTFMIHNTPLLYGSNGYSQGTMWTGQGFRPAGEHPEYDLNFNAYIGSPFLTNIVDADDKWFSYQSSNQTIVLKI